MLVFGSVALCWRFVLTAFRVPMRLPMLMLFVTISRFAMLVLTRASNGRRSVSTCMNLMPAAPKDAVQQHR